MITDSDGKIAAVEICRECALISKARLFRYHDTNRMQRDKRCASSRGLPRTRPFPPSPRTPVSCRCTLSYKLRTSPDRAAPRPTDCWHTLACPKSRKECDCRPCKTRLDRRHTILDTWSASHADFRSTVSRWPSRDSRREDPRTNDCTRRKRADSSGACTPRRFRSSPVVTTPSTRPLDRRIYRNTRRKWSDSSEACSQHFWCIRHQEPTWRSARSDRDTDDCKYRTSEGRCAPCKIRSLDTRRSWPT